MSHKESTHENYEIVGIRWAVGVRRLAHFQGGDVQKGLAEMAEQTNAMIDDLLWWTTALKTARGAAK
jgi:hypothetical protein